MQLRDIVAAPWAIEPAMFEEVQGIYARHMRGEKIDLQGIEARIGRPLNNTRQPMQVTPDGVAVIALDGVIAKRANLMTQISGGTSSQIVGQQFAEALADDSVKAIVLAVDSPGGTVDGTQALADQIYAARGTKPTIAYVDGTCCSAAYWIASACDKVVVGGDTAQVGSIGVIATHVDQSFAEAQRGVRVTEIKAGKYKGTGSPHAPLGAGESIMQAQVDHMYAVFLGAVARNRGVSVDAVAQDMAEGRVFLGRKAIDAGLADGVSTLADVIAELSGDSESDDDERNDTFEAVGAGVPVVAVDSTINHEVSTMLTIEQVRAEAPDVAQAFATAERERIAAIQKLTRPGCEALVAELIADGKTTAPEAALRILAAVDAQAAAKAEAEAEAKAAKLAAIKADAAEVVVAAAPAADAAKGDDAIDYHHVSREARALMDTEAVRGVKLTEAEAVARVLARAKV